jgi:O-antigen/teichoic acid export membrane protein
MIPIIHKKARQFLTNIIYAFLAQGISLLLSLVMSFIVPKLLGVKEFGYWQLFLFYTNYTGALTLGLNSGIYLQLGGKKYQELEYSPLGNQLRASIVVQMVFALLFAVYASVFEVDPKRKFVMCCVAAQMVICNAIDFLGCIYQAVNRTKIYSMSVIIDKISFLVFVLALLISKAQHFQIFVLLLLAGKIISLIYCFYIGRKIVFSPWMRSQNVILEMGRNMAVGISLMFSYFADALILGIGRFVVDGLWGIEAFGKLSFSLSLASYFLLFIGQISMVLFPVLRQIDHEKLRQIYKVGRDFLSIVLEGLFLAYLPMKYVLGLWLPQYRESLQYLALLLPICTFDGKMQMLCSTYLKVLRKERILLAINLMGCAVSLALCLTSGFLFHSLLAVVISMSVSVAFRGMGADLYLSKIMGIHVVSSLGQEVILVVIFVSSTWFLSPVFGFLIYLLAYTIYLWTVRDKIKAVKEVGKLYLKPQKSGQE